MDSYVYLRNVESYPVEYLVDLIAGDGVFREEGVDDELDI